MAGRSEIEAIYYYKTEWLKDAVADGKAVTRGTTTTCGLERINARVLGQVT